MVTVAAGMAAFVPSTITSLSCARAVSLASAGTWDRVARVRRAAARAVVSLMI
jgi:hypothetical protein